MVTYGTEEAKEGITKTVLSVLEDDIKKINKDIEDVKWRIHKVEKALDMTKKLMEEKK